LDADEHGWPRILSDFSFSAFVRGCESLLDRRRGGEKKGAADWSLVEARGKLGGIRQQYLRRAA
jgi:hypothetical protein